MILSLDESIQKLKTEILSQDWSLPQRKIDPLQAAFTCLKNRLKTRKNALAILTMADSVLRYARKRQGRVPPEFIDFLKEAMAHVVNMYEDGRLDPDKDAELFKRMHGKFARLKEKVALEKDASPKPAGQAPEGSGAELEPLPDPHPRNETTTASAQVKSVSIPAAGVSAKTLPENSGTAPLPVQPGTMLRSLTIGKLPLVIAEEHIALIQALSPKNRKKYFESSQIPLKDLDGWFRRLSSQVTGPLALLKNSALKKLILPLMTPRGMDLTDTPDDEAAWLVVLSKGRWHGVILCRRIEEKATPLLSLSRAKNGDIAGLAQLGKDQVLPLLDINPLLEREGFLCMPV